MKHKLQFLGLLLGLLATSFSNAAPYFQGQQNLPPQLTPLPASTVREQDFIQLSIGAIDPEGQPLTYLWSFANDPTGQAAFWKTDGSFAPSIEHANLVKVAVRQGPNFPNPSFQGQQISVKVDVSDGVNVASHTYNVPVGGVNLPPEIVVDTSGLGTAQSPRMEGTGFGVSAAASKDPDGSSIKFIWAIIRMIGPGPCAGAGALVLQGKETPHPGFVVPKMGSLPNGPTLITLEYIVEDGLYVLEGTFTGYAASPQGCASAVNSPPTVTLAADPAVASFGQTVTLSATVFDPGDTHTHSWVQLNTTGGNAVVLSSPNAATTTFVAPSAAATLAFRFKATDSAGQSATDTISVLVAQSGGSGDPPDPPPPTNRDPSVNLKYAFLEAGPQAENPTAPVVVTAPAQIMLTAIGSDPDGDPLVYKWTMVPSLAGVVLGSGDAQRTLSVGSGVSGTVAVGVTAEDGKGGTASRSATFQIQPPPDKPVSAKAKVLVASQPVTGPVAPGVMITLSGEQSSVVNGSSEENAKLAFLWEQTSGPKAFSRNLSSKNAEIVVDGIESAQTLGFKLTVRNGNAAATANVSLAVDPALRPKPELEDEGELYFARVGFGPTGALVFQTVLVLDNLSPEDATDVRIEFFDSNGQPLDVRYFEIGESGSELKPWNSAQPFVVAARSSRALEFRALEGAELTVGWAKVSSSAKLRGSVRFQLVDEMGQFLSDVGIFSSPRGKSFQAAFRSRDKLAFAVSNPEDVPVNVRVKVSSRIHAATVEDVMTLQPGAHTANFLTDFFFLSNLDVFNEGTLSIEVEGGKTVVATALITRDRLAVSSQSFAKIE